MARIDAAPFEASEYPNNKNAIAEYLSDALEENDPFLFLAALADIAKARGMAKMAKDAGLGRESLYKALAPGAKPRYDTILKLAKAAGVKFTVAPIGNAPQFVQPTLADKLVELRPLRQNHAARLLRAAADGQLWNLKITVVPGPDTIDSYIATALQGRDAGTVMPFVIVRRDTGKIVGSTRFWKLDRANRKLEIGHTWLSESIQRSGINTEAKYLLLSHAFEVMQAVRVQFTTDELNHKSRVAILRIGAKQEGIVRHERIMPDGRKRNSVRFSIIDSEWADVKATLQHRMERQI